MIPLQQGLFPYCGGQWDSSSCVDLLSEVKSSVRRPSTSLFTGVYDGLPPFIQGNERRNECFKVYSSAQKYNLSETNGFHLQNMLS